MSFLPAMIVNGELIATIKMVMTGGWFIVDTLRRPQTSMLKYHQISRTQQTPERNTQNGGPQPEKPSINWWIVQHTMFDMFDNCYLWAKYGHDHDLRL